MQYIFSSLNPMLSIIIPTLNEEKYLPRLLRSIKSQDFEDFEIIVSDGNSQDQTQSIAKKFNAKLVINQKRSPAHQRNHGAEFAQGSILLFLDADAILPKNFLSSVINEFINKNLDIASFDFEPDTKKILYKLYAWFYISVCFIFQYIKPVSIGAGIMIKKNLHEKINGFDPNIFIGEDHDYSQRAGKLGKFRIINSKKVFFSMRRFEKHGAFKTLIKWLYCTIYALIKGPIKKKIIKYEFGNN